MKTIVDLSVTSALFRRRQGWSPGQLFGPAVPGGWYDPSDPTSVFADISGTQVAAIGESVARLNDKSGNGLHAIQTISAARPILRKDSSGRRYLDFDGVDDRLSSAPLNLSGHLKLTVAAGVRKRDGGAARAIMGHHVSSLNAGGFDLLASTGANDIIGALARSTAGSSGQIGVSSHLLSPTTFVMLAQVNFAASAGAECLVRLNGTTMAQNIGVIQDNTGTFGNGSLFLGSRANNTLFLNGRLYSLIVIAAELDAAAVVSLEDHVTSRTGVAA